MKKVLISGFILLALIPSFAGFNFVPQIAYAQSTTATQPAPTQTVTPPAQNNSSSGCNLGSGILNCITEGISHVVLIIPGWIASYVILPLAGWVTTLSGLLLNFVVNQTIVQMGSDFAAGHPTGDAISNIWGTVRDLANMFFIFALLYTAILTMFGKGNFRETIVKMIVAALLINFSLFFTEVIIDAGNLLALTFYHAIVGAQLPNSSAFDYGISNALMNQLHITSIWKNTSILNGTQLFTVGIVGSIFALIAAFVFFSVAIMFVIRYVVLIFVLILSPLMFAGFILPNFQGYSKQWRDALIGQTFFAPLYFFLTWIVVKLSLTIFSGSPSDLSAATALTTNAAGQITTSASTFGVLLHFVMMIAFLIASLAIAKSYANKAGPGVASATKWATGFAGGTVFGLTGAVGRGTIGRYAQTVADNKDLRERAARGDRMARLQLAAAERTSKASFDIRGTKLNKNLNAGKAKEGGFAADTKAKQKRLEDLTKSLGATEAEKKEHQEDVSRAQRGQEAAEAALNNARQKAQKEAEEAMQTPELEAAEKAEQEAEKRLNAPIKLGETVDRSTLQAEYDNAKREADRLRIERDEKRKAYINEATAEHEAAYAYAKSSAETIKKEGDAGKRRAERAAQYREEKMNPDNARNSGWRRWVPSTDRVVFFGKFKREETEAPGIIRKAAKGKSKREQLADLAKEVQKEEDTTSEKPKEEGTEKKPEGDSEKPTT